MLKLITRISIVLLVTSYGVVVAQEATVATGGDATGTGGTASYTVGQVIYTANSGSNGSS
ncbi:MAG: T9SS C-terminal target domain-containing protein, partial [Bacteroidetes bacterium]|nr:T9SS C-terminal target domain-containing protein [Bacteroidota bacterium]